MIGTRITQMTRVFTDFFILENPRKPALSVSSAFQLKKSAKTRVIRVIRVPIKKKSAKTRVIRVICVPIKKKIREDPRHPCHPRSNQSKYEKTVKPPFIYFLLSYASIISANILQ
jgi:hypothetical protein